MKNMEPKEFIPFIVALILAIAAFFGIQLTEAELTAIITAGITLILALIAIWQREQKIKKSDALTVSLVNNGKLSGQVNALISPDTVKPGVIETLPARAWKMNDETKHWLCSGAFAPFCPGILAQITAAEADHKVHYFVDTGYNGIQYEIEYGLLKQQIGAA